MIRKSFIFFILLCGCVVQAAEQWYQSQEGGREVEAMRDTMRECYPFDEEVWETCLNYDGYLPVESPVALVPFSPHKEDACDLERMVKRELDDALADQNSVWVMIVCGGQRYAGLYDVGEEKVSWTLSGGANGARALIMPMMDYLKNEALRGYEKRLLCSPQRDFSKELDCVGGSLNTPRYKRCAFFSRCLRVFLTIFCPKLKGKGKVVWGDCGKRLTREVLRRLEPPCGQCLRFIFQEKEKALSEVFSAKESDPIKVFMTLPGFGVVKGCFVPRPPEFKEGGVLPSEYFLHHKINAMKDTLRARYPFDKENCCASIILDLSLCKWRRLAFLSELRR